MVSVQVSLNLVGIVGLLACTEVNAAMVTLFTSASLDNWNSILWVDAS